MTAEEDFVDLDRSVELRADVLAAAYHLGRAVGWREANRCV